jgi:hypothetical protein
VAVNVGLYITAAYSAIVTGKFCAE